MDWNIVIGIVAIVVAIIGIIINMIYSKKDSKKSNNSYECEITNNVKGNNDKIMNRVDMVEKNNKNL